MTSPTRQLDNVCHIRNDTSSEVDDRLNIIYGEKNVSTDKNNRLKMQKKKNHYERKTFLSTV